MKIVKVVAYPGLALKKFNGLDPNEDARDFLDIVEKKDSIFPRI